MLGCVTRTMRRSVHAGTTCRKLWCSEANCGGSSGGGRACCMMIAAAALNGARPAAVWVGFANAVRDAGPLASRLFGYSRKLI